MNAKCIDYKTTAHDKLDAFFVIAFEGCGFLYEPTTKHTDLHNIKSVLLQFLIEKLTNNRNKT